MEINKRFSNISIPFANDPADADVLIFLTLNSTPLNEEEIKTIIDTYIRCDRNDWITIFSLSGVRFVVSDRASYAFAEDCKTLIDNFHLPAITTWMIALTMYYALPLKWITGNNNRIKCLFPSNTSETTEYCENFLQSAKTIMGENGWKKPYILLK